jgi:hypothetical protein
LCVLLDANQQAIASAGDSKMRRPTQTQQPKATLASRLFVSGSTLAFSALMGAVILALRSGRI